MSREDQGLKDLQHFLRLASAQVNHQIKKAEESEPYSARINQMRMLGELIKEQVNGNEYTGQDPRRSTRPTR